MQRILASQTALNIEGFFPPLDTPCTGSFLGFLILAAGVSGSSSATSSNFRFFEVDGIVESPDGS